MRPIVSLALAFLLTGQALAAPKSRLSEIKDDDTKAWWALTEQLSGDDMEGRDTGSLAYQKAADLVVKRFQAAGLVPGGENGTYFQTVPLREVEVEPRGGFLRSSGQAGPGPRPRKASSACPCRPFQALGGWPNGSPCSSCTR